METQATIPSTSVNVDLSQRIGDSYNRPQKQTELGYLPSFAR